VAASERIESSRTELPLDVWAAFLSPQPKVVALKVLETFT
jgi:hypothetical protein